MALLACLPAFVWAKDSLVDVYRVEGTSMEPALREGDYVLVRKCEFGALLDVLWSLLPFSGDGGDDVSIEDDDEKMNNARTRERSHQRQQQQRTLDAMDRARLVKHEMMAGVVTTNAPVARVYDTPPAALPGHVVIYKHPLAYCPRTLSVKRVIAVGGQVLQLPTGSEGVSASSTSSRRRITTTAVVPPYFLHVEGTGAGRAFVAELILVFIILPELTLVARTFRRMMPFRRQSCQQLGQPTIGAHQQRPIGRGGRGGGVAALGPVGTHLAADAGRSEDYKWCSRQRR
jgi:signal peptidase I